MQQGWWVKYQASQNSLQSATDNECIPTRGESQWSQGLRPEFCSSVSSEKTWRDLELTDWQLHIWSGIRWQALHMERNFSCYQQFVWPWVCCPVMIQGKSLNRELNLPWSSRIGMNLFQQNISKYTDPMYQPHCPALKRGRYVSFQMQLPWL